MGFSSGPRHANGVYWHNTVIVPESLAAGLDGLAGGRAGIGLVMLTVNEEDR